MSASLVGSEMCIRDRWVATAQAIAAAAALAAAPRSWQEVRRAAHLKAAPSSASWQEVLGDITVPEFRER
eukprot:10831422-Alexandrium_andersonii.AAC.1